MDMERSNNTPPAANLVPKVADSGGLCSSSFSDMNSARQLYSARSALSLYLDFLQKEFNST